MNIEEIKQEFLSVPQQPFFSFDHASHVYKFRSTQLPSVTQIIKGANLIDTAWFTGDARNRGTAVHAAAHYLDEGDLDWSSVQDVYKGYIEAQQLFMKQSGFIPILIEWSGYHPSYFFGGMLDRLGFVNCKLTLLDYKTGEIAKWVALQLAAYEELVKVVFGAILKKYNLRIHRQAVQLRANGLYRLADAKIFKQDDFRTFLSAVNIYKWNQ